MPGDEELWNKLSRGEVQAFEGFYRALFINRSLSGTHH